MAESRNQLPPALRGSHLPLPGRPCQLSPLPCPRRARDRAPVLLTLQSSPRRSAPGLYLAPRHRTACEMH